MSTFIIMSRFTTETFRKPSDIKQRAVEVRDQLKQRCPEVEWKQSYATVGHYDVVDIVEAPNERSVAEAALAIRGIGRCRAEVLTAIPWKEFLATL